MRGQIFMKVGSEESQRPVLLGPFIAHLCWQMQINTSHEVSVCATFFLTSTLNFQPLHLNSPDHAQIAPKHRCFSSASF